MYTIEDDLPLKHCGGKRAGCVAGSLYSLIVSVDSISCALSLWCCVFILFVFGQCLIGSITLVLFARVHSNVDINMGIFNDY